jgi:hypothetical protein
LIAKYVEPQTTYTVQRAVRNFQRAGAAMIYGTQRSPTP